MSPSISTSILVRVTPRCVALANNPTDTHEPSAARAVSEGLGAESSPSSAGGSPTSIGARSRT